ncbi:acyltransferase family protein [Azospirillum sp.]|uniref:acyltransferase family protein n=1 Tax=Azospirillum sp. TaxID=34012 RepID=UPI003D728D29
MRPDTAEDRLVALDALRGMAILLVVIWHYAVVWVGPATHNPVRIALGLSWTGVDLFFVLSGYLIGGILLDNRDSGTFFQTFYGRRALRILPLYALSLALFVLLGDHDERTPFWSYLLLVQNFVWAAQGAWGPDWTGVTWSLAVEEHFYLLLPLLIRFTPRRALPVVFLCFAALGPLVRATGMVSGLTPVSAFLLSPARFDPLFLGVFAAWLVRAPAGADILRRRRAALGWALLAAFGGITAVTLVRWEPITLGKATAGYSLIVGFYLLLLLNVVTRPVPRALAGVATVLSWLGIGAYSIYLFHVPVLILVRRAVTTPGLAEVVALALVLAMARLCWIYIERPSMAYGRRHFRYRRTPSEEIPLSAVPPVPRAWDGNAIQAERP